MDANNFVGPSGNGYDVYVGGKKVGSYPDLNSAQQAYNQNFYAAGSSSAATPTNAGSMQALLDAIATGDTNKFNEAVRQFNIGSTESGRQFDVNTALKQQQDYSSMAQDLLKTAASLRGPQDYYQYNSYLNGGKDLMSQIYGNQPLAAFQKPTNSWTPANINDTMASLGFRASPGLPTHFWNPVTQNWFNQPPPPAAGAPPTSPTSSIGTTGTPVFDQGGSVQGPPGSHVLALLQSGERVIPANQVQGARKGPRSYTKEGLPVFDQGGVAGADPSGSSIPSMSDPTASSQPKSLSPAYPSPGSLTHTPSRAPAAPGMFDPYASMGMSDPSGYVAPKVSSSMPSWWGAPSATPPVNPNAAPLPFKMNPAVYDSMDPTGKALLQSLVTSPQGGGWDWNDYLMQLNAQRPQGTAPAYSIFNYYTPEATRASSAGLPGAY